jgi:tetratricopeptide (TPR) repeat protein
VKPRHVSDNNIRKMNLTENQISEFNTYYNNGCSLQKGIILLDGYKPKNLGFFEKMRAKKALKSFEKALEIYPESWQSLFFIGKIYQRMREFQKSLSYIEKAMVFEKENHVLPQEASLVAMHLNEIEKSIEFSKMSVTISPENFALLGNHSMNLLVAELDDEAKDTIEKALLINPNDDYNKRIKQKIENVISGKERRPTYSDAIG